MKNVSKSSNASARREARSGNTAGRSADRVSRSHDMRHEASSVSREKKARPSASPVTDKLVSVRCARRLIYAADAGGPKAACEMIFETSQGHRHSVQVDPVELQRPATVIAKAVNQTALYPLDETALRALVQAGIDSNPPMVTMTTVSGWKDRGASRAFVTPGRSFGPGRSSYRYASSEDHASGAGQLGSVRGDLKGWRQNVGVYLEMSTAGCVLFGAAMAAPLLRVANIPESWIMLLCGGSTSGKSTLLAGVASFQGSETTINPRTSERRFTELAARHNDLLMPVGDLSQLPKGDRRQVLHRLTMDSTSGAGRSVSRAVRGSLPDLTFTTIAAASAEHSSVEIAREAGVRRLPGEQVRCFDLPPGKKGYFDRTGRSGLAADVITRRINEGVVEHYGAGLRTWINWLAKQDEARAVKQLNVRIDRFVRMASSSGPLSALEARAARKFGLICAALAMGREAGIVGISTVNALKACRKAFRSAISAAAALDPDAALKALKSALQAKHAIVRTYQGDEVVRRQLRKHPDWLAVETKRDGHRAIGVHPPSVRKALGQGVADIAFEELQARGLLSQEKGVARWQKKLPGLPTKVRLLQLDVRWLADG